MSLTKLEKRKAALIEWSKYVDTLTPEEADILIKPIKDYLDNHPELKWQDFNPTNPPAVSWEHTLMIRNNAEVVCFLARITESDTEDTKEDWFLSDHTALSDLLDFYDGCTYKLIKL
jgi:hypothetical protein